MVEKRTTGSIVTNELPKNHVKLIVEELSIYTEKAGTKKRYVRFTLFESEYFYEKYKGCTPPEEFCISIPLDEMPDFDSYISKGFQILLIDECDLISILKYF